MRCTRGAALKLQWTDLKSPRSTEFWDVLKALQLQCNRPDLPDVSCGDAGKHHLHWARAADDFWS